MCEIRHESLLCEIRDGKRRKRRRDKKDRDGGNRKRKREDIEYKIGLREEGRCRREEIIIGEEEIEGGMKRRKETGKTDRIDGGRRMQANYGVGQMKWEENRRKQEENRQREEEDIEIEEEGTEKIGRMRRLEDERDRR